MKQNLNILFPFEVTECNCGYKFVLYSVFEDVLIQSVRNIYCPACGERIA